MTRVDYTLEVATRDDFDEIVEVFAEGFSDDPLSRFIMPKAAQRSRWMPRILRATTDLAFRHGIVVIARAAAGEILGVAAWFPDGRLAEPSFLRSLQYMPRLLPLQLNPFVALRSLRVVKMTNYLRPRAFRGGFYLNGIAVRRIHQGSGIASALLKDGLARAEAAGSSIHLIASSEVASFYESHGFSAVLESQLPGVEVVYCNFFQGTGPVPTSAHAEAALNVHGVLPPWALPLFAWSPVLLGLLLIPVGYLVGWFGVGHTVLDGSLFVVMGLMVGCAAGQVPALLYYLVKGRWRLALTTLLSGSIFAGAVAVFKMLS